MRSLISFIVLCLYLAFFATPVQADKTDIIILSNGDRITGEIKNLAAAQLEVKTDYMGTVFIDWENIRNLISSIGQQIELSDGERLVGTIDKSPEDKDLIVITTADGQMGLDSARVVRMYPVGGGFWDRMDVNISLGFNFDKSSDVGKYNLSSDAIYRDPEFITLGRFSSEITTQQELENTRRNVLNISHLTFQPNKKYISYSGSMEQNDQLGIDLRTLLGIGYGWVPISDGHTWLTLGVGLAGNLEKPFDNGDTDANLEGVGTIRYQYYQRSTPERSLDVYFQVFPSITQSNRVRADFTATARWEIIRDFFIGLDFYSSYDSQPPSELASEIDYGVRTTVGYKF